LENSQLSPGMCLLNCSSSVEKLHNVWKSMRKKWEKNEAFMIFQMDERWYRFQCGLKIKNAIIREGRDMANANFDNGFASHIIIQAGGRALGQWQNQTKKIKEKMHFHNRKIFGQKSAKSGGRAIYIIRL
jgi:hypothetical protein